MFHLVQLLRIDTFNKKVFLLTPSTNIIKAIKQQWNENQIPYNQILSSEIIQDGSSIIKTNRTSQIGGAILGNIILGPVGLILGGLTGIKRSEGKVSKIEFRILINDIKNPTHIINFFNQDTSTSSSTYKHAINSARQLHDILSIIIKEVDSEDDSKKPENKSTAIKTSVADELVKLTDLLKTGAITLDEFNKLKIQIIGSSQ